MNAQLTKQSKPTLVNVIAWMTLASGIVNIIWGIAASAAALHTVIGFICTPFTILPTVLGIFEVIYAAKLFSIPPQAVKPSTTIAILEIVAVVAGNLFSMVVGILALVFYNDATVRDYFASLNGTLASVAAVVPVAPAKPEVAAVAPDESTPTEESHSSEEETPKG